MAAQLDRQRPTFTYTIRLEPAVEGGFNVFVPALPGCLTQGATYGEALSMAEEAIEGFLEALVEAGQEIPVEPEPALPVTTAVRVRRPRGA